MNTKTQPTMNASKQRDYMEALRALVNSTGKVSLRQLASDHKVSQFWTPALQKLGWVSTSKGRHGGSRWIGPKPRTEDELFKMATLLRESMVPFMTTRKAEEPKVEQPVSGEQRRSQVATVNAPVKIVKSPVKPAVKRTAPRREVSILWGMVKWTR
jgi:hypothetical protein